MAWIWVIYLGSLRLKMLLTILYIIGITAEGMTGALAAGRHNMDWFGAIAITL